MKLGPISVRRLAILCAGLAAIGFWAWFIASGHMARFERSTYSRASEQATFATAAKRGTTYSDLRLQAEQCGVNLGCRDRVLYDNQLDDYLASVRLKEMAVILLVMAAWSVAAFFATYLLAYSIRFTTDRFWPWLTGR